METMAVDVLPPMPQSQYNMQPRTLDQSQCPRAPGSLQLSMNTSLTVTGTVTVAVSVDSVDHDHKDP
jgi:hypothetical protein